MPRILLLLFLGIVVSAAEVPAPPAILDSLRQGHPRLLLTDQRLAELTALAKDDPLLRRCIAEVLATADTACAAKPLQRVLVGPRLLQVSRDCLRRILSLGLAWRLSGEDRYLQAGKRTLAEVGGFSDWNPSHFLDVAEMSTAVGIGLDWLWAGLDERERADIRAALLRHGLDPGITASGGWDKELKPAWWCTSAYNWNQVCHGGLLVGALAVADSDPRYLRRLLPQAIAELPLALASYDPDGAWPEGPGYWGYATDYTVFALSALDTALGSICGLDGGRGLRNAGQYLTSVEGPTGLLPNFADVGDRSRFTGSPTLWWLSGHFQLPALAAQQVAALAKRSAKPLDVVWYHHAPGTPPAQPLDARCDGPVQLAVFRSAWNDPEALYVYVKAGFNRVNHGHLDLGSFEFDLLGERWARDLGSDDYNMPGYFSSQPNGKRWSYFRLNSHSHSVPLIDDLDQAVEGQASLCTFASSDTPHAIVDLTSAYPRTTTRLQRGIALVDQRRALLVQDEADLVGSHGLTWAMTTDAAVTLAGIEARLALNGKSITGRILSPPGAVFTVETAERHLPEKPNGGVRRLLVQLPGSTGQVRIAVVFAVAPPAMAVQPLSAW